MAELQALVRAAREGEEALEGLTTAAEALRARLALGADPAVCEQHALQLREAADRLRSALDAALQAGDVALARGEPYAAPAHRLGQELAALSALATDCCRHAYQRPPDPQLFDGRDLFSIRCSLLAHAP